MERNNEFPYILCLLLALATQKVAKKMDPGPKGSAWPNSDTWRGPVLVCNTLPDQTAFFNAVDEKIGREG